jgi:hypothetical protein
MIPVIDYLPVITETMELELGIFCSSSYMVIRAVWLAGYGVHNFDSFILCSLRAASCISG